jgi:hypothetical protein
MSRLSSFLRTYINFRISASIWQYFFCAMKNLKDIVKTNVRRTLETPCRSHLHENNSKNMNKFSSVLRHNLSFSRSLRNKSNERQDIQQCTVHSIIYIEAYIALFCLLKELFEKIASAQQEAGSNLVF